MFIAYKSRNDMPMQMWRHVAERGEVDFFRFELGAKNFFDCEHDRHEMRAFIFAEVSHFAHVPLPNYAAKTWVIGIVDPHDAAMRILPE